jgi:hypothetical protein
VVHACHSNKGGKCKIGLCFRSVWAKWEILFPKWSELKKGWGVAQAVKCLPYKYEALSSNSSTTPPKKKKKIAQ